MSDEPIDTTTPRRVSLQEAAKISRAIYHEMKAKEDAARQREADSYVDSDILDLRTQLAAALDRIAALERRLDDQEAGK